MHETKREPLSAYPRLSDDDGLVDAGPVLALPECGPEVRLDRVRRRAGEVRVVAVQIRLDDVFIRERPYRAVRQVIGRDCSQKFLSPSIHIVVGNFCEQSLPITCRDAQYNACSISLP